MTREQAKEFLPLIQALADNKTIQIYHQSNGKWEDIDDPKFTSPRDRYRVKPKPEYRPFKNGKECWEEMIKHSPFGWVMNKEFGTLSNIIFMNNYTIELTPVNLKYDRDDQACGIDRVIFDFKNVFDLFKFADGAPFGVKE